MHLGNQLGPLGEVKSMCTYFLLLLVPQAHEAPVNTHIPPLCFGLLWTPDSNICDITQSIVFLNTEFSTQDFSIFFTKDEI